MTTTLYRTNFQRKWYKLNKVRVGEDLSWIGIANVLANPEQYASELILMQGGDIQESHSLEVKHNNREYYAQGIQSVVGFDFD